MKCELCHNAEAVKAITRERNGEEEELYVCEACAKAEHARHQKLSHRTRKISGLPPGVEMSVTEIGPDSGHGEPPPFLGALVDAFSDMVGEIGKSRNRSEAGPDRSDWKEFPCGRVPADFRIGARIHLEGLHLIGEFEAVKRALHALDIDLVGITADGVKDCGHVYKVRYACALPMVKRVIGDLLREEKNARVRLFEEMPRVFGDSLCRAIAVVKNCRLLSSGELFDILSPLGIAAREGLLDGITHDELVELRNSCDLSSEEDSLSPVERDRVDGERADKMNARFENVILNEKAEEMFR